MVGRSERAIALAFVYQGYMNRPSARIVADENGKARFTTAEFLRMAEAGAFDDMKIELVRGELERMNPPLSGHGLRQMDVGFRLRTALENVTELRVTGETGIDVGGETVRGCDLAIIKLAPSESRLLQPEEVLLVVEIADTTLSRDLGPKRSDYARAGIPHYWVVDGERQVVHIFEAPVAGDYKEIRTVAFGSPLAVPGTGKTITLD